MQQRYLNFTAFINQRALQIQKFTQILKSDTVKRTHQSLPKSIRRRAMSHNRYRIPVRLRKSLETDLIKNESMQKMPKCRKNIRKRHRLMLSYKMRSDKCKWLSTHMWAAKRMRMCKYGGYKIAESPNNKSFRSAYRSFRSNSCLIDYSYMSCMTIEQVSENLSAFILPQEIRLKNGGRQVDEVDRLYQGQLYHYRERKSKQRQKQETMSMDLQDQYKQHQDKYEFICPLLILVQDKTTIHCLFDPFTLQDIQKIGKQSSSDVGRGWAGVFCKSVQSCLSNDVSMKINVHIDKVKPELYLLLGPQSLTRVHQCMKKLQVPVQKQVSQVLSAGSLNMQTFNYKLIYINCEQSKSINDKSRPMVSQPIKQRIVQNYDVLENRRLRQLFFSNLAIYNRNNKNRVNLNNMQVSDQKQQAQTKENKSEYFWQFYEKLNRDLMNQSQKNSQYIYQITNRSKYTHKRNNKLTKQQKKKILISDSQSRIGMKTPQKQAQNQKSKPKVNDSQKSIKVEESGQHRQRMDIQQYQKQTIQIPKLCTQSNKAYDPLLVIPFTSQKTDNYSTYQGCFVLCSSKNNCQIWRALSQTNVKVIGRKQMRHCVFQAGLRLFPQDYPQAVSFQRYNRTRAMQLIERHKRLPDRKRINYEKINSPYPFYYYTPKIEANGNGWSCIRNVKISILSRGRCFPGSYICKLQTQDYQQILDSIDNAGLIKSIVSQQQTVSEQAQTKSKQLNLVDYKTQSYQQIISFLGETSTQTKRKIIGFVTYGGFCQSYGKQAGIGFIFDVDYLKARSKLNEHQSQYVLVRKNTSKFYYVATVNKY